MTDSEVQHQGEGSEELDQLSNALNSLDDEALGDLFEIVRRFAGQPISERSGTRLAIDFSNFLGQENSVAGSFLLFAIARPEDHEVESVLSERLRAWIARANRLAGRNAILAIRAGEVGVLDWEYTGGNIVTVFGNPESNVVLFRLKIGRIDGQTLLLEMTVDSAIRLLRNFARELADLVVPELMDNVDNEDIDGLPRSVEKIVVAMTASQAAPEDPAGVLPAT